MRSQAKRDLSLICREANKICEDCALNSGACQDVMKSIDALWSEDECEVCGHCKAVTLGKNFYWPQIEKKDFTCW